MHKQCIKNLSGMVKTEIKHSTLIGNYEDGDLNNVDLSSKFRSIQAIWVRKALDETNFHPWIVVSNEIGVSILITNLFLAKQKQKYLSNAITIQQQIDIWQSMSQGT